jgi:hypothetical protein
MPYILASDREYAKLRPAIAGELNYAITMLCLDYWKTAESYQSINDIIGALECAKQEFYRRVAVPYEEGKKAANGDVYAE